METYRRGHNGPDSKSGIQQCIVGSNPTLSAKNFLIWTPVKGFGLESFFVFRHKNSRILLRLCVNFGYASESRIASFFIKIKYIIQLSYWAKLAAKTTQSYLQTNQNVSQGKFANIQLFLHIYLRWRKTHGTVFSKGAENSTSKSLLPKRVEVYGCLGAFPGQKAT